MLETFLVAYRSRALTVLPKIFGESFWGPYGLGGFGESREEIGTKAIREFKSSSVREVVSIQIVEVRVIIIEDGNKRVEKESDWDI